MLGVNASAGITFGPVLRATLEPLFVSGLLELVKQAVDAQVDLTKKIPKADPAKDSKMDIVRACFQEVVSPKAGRELKREFIRTVLLDVLFLTKKADEDKKKAEENKKTDIDPMSLMSLYRGLQKECLQKIHAKAGKMLDNLAKSEPINLLPADLKEALCQALSKGLGNFIDTVG